MKRYKYFEMDDEFFKNINLFLRDYPYFEGKLLKQSVLQTEGQDLQSYLLQLSDDKALILREDDYILINDNDTSDTLVLSNELFWTEFTYISENEVVRKKGFLEELDEDLIEIQKSENDHGAMKWYINDFTGYLQNILSCMSTKDAADKLRKLIETLKQEK